jgi:hypothetical protein
MRSRPAVLLASLAATVLLAACGGGNDKAAETIPAAPALTVPGDSTPPTLPKVSGTTGATGSTGATGNSNSTTPSTTPSTPSGGTPAPATGGTPADSQQNDQPPPAGSPAEKFEQFCKENPGAC